MPVSRARLPNLSSPRPTTPPACPRSEPELYQQGAYHRPREGVPAVHWYGDDHHERLPHCKIHPGRADGALCAHHQRVSGVLARSPQLLHPLAPALACPCCTPRAPLVGGHPSRVAYRVRCAQSAARVRVSNEYRARAAGAPRVEGEEAASYCVSLTRRKPHTYTYR